MKIILYKSYLWPPYQIEPNIDERLSNIDSKKVMHLKMTKIENDLDIYYVVWITNNQKQEKEIAAIMKKRNSSGGELI